MIFWYMKIVLGLFSERYTSVAALISLTNKHSNCVSDKWSANYLGPMFLMLGLHVDDYKPYKHDWVAQGFLHTRNPTSTAPSIAIPRTLQPCYPGHLSPGLPAKRSGRQSRVVTHSKWPGWKTYDAPFGTKLGNWVIRLTSLTCGSLALQKI